MFLITRANHEVRRVVAEKNIFKEGKQILHHTKKNNLTEWMMNPMICRLLMSS